MVVSRWRALGSQVLVAVTDPDALNEARRVVAEQVDALDQACSRFRDDSDLSRLNSADGAPVLVTPLLHQALRVALRAARLTHGAVDPTVGCSMQRIGYDSDFASVASHGAAVRLDCRPAPGWTTVQLSNDPPIVVLPRGTSLDLGATAKALGSDLAAAAAHRHTNAGVLVSLGGDIAVAGEPPAGGWQVRVTDDHRGPDSAPGQQITLSTGGLATSSSTVRHWQRGDVRLHHIIDPRTGLPAPSPYRTVSVAAATCVEANTASTAALVRGASARDWLIEQGLPARLVTHEGLVLHLNHWPVCGERAA